VLPWLNRILKFMGRSTYLKNGHKIIQVVPYNSQKMSTAIHLNK
jgi:hypothetical protein